MKEKNIVRDLIYFKSKVHCSKTNFSLHEILGGKVRYFSGLYSEEVSLYIAKDHLQRAVDLLAFHNIFLEEEDK